MKFLQNKLGVHQLSLFDLDVIQAESTEGLSAICKALAGNSSLILFGCEVTKSGNFYTWTAGAIYHQGEIYQVDASNAPLNSTSTPYWKIYTVNIKPTFVNNILNILTGDYPVRHLLGGNFIIHKEKKVTLGNTTLDGEIQISAPGGYFLPIAGQGIQNGGGGGVPIGFIGGWNGGNVPAGWGLCDGQNGRPLVNEDNSYIMGAGSGNTGDVGGSNLITESNIPSHGHTFSHNFSIGAGGGHTHTYTEPNGEQGHKHQVTGKRLVNIANNDEYRWMLDPGIIENTNYSTTGITINSVADHTHTISGTGTIGSTGGGVAFQPKYRKVKFIIRTF
jgi:hypothetical protein